MYNFLLYVHSWLRWGIIIISALVLFKFIYAKIKQKKFGKPDNILSAVFVGCIHLQVIIGCLLYFVYSPITQSAMKNMGASMKNATLRFWAVEHISLMILAAIIAQIGRSMVKKKATDNKKFSTSILFFVITIMIILIGIPWGSRVLFRL